MKFRLTIGENGTKWGKQYPVYEDEKSNAIEFLQSARDYFYTLANKEDADFFLQNCCWIDAGTDTIAVDVANIVF